jgi:hypothetical protein
VDLDRVKPVKRERQDYKVTELKGRVRSLKQTLFMATANCHGAHVAAALGLPFLVRMEAAIRDGFDADELWPWWDRRKAS